MSSLTRALVAALCVSGAVANMDMGGVNCTELGGMEKGNGGMHLRRLSDGMHGGDNTGHGAEPLMCSALSQLFNVEDKYLSIASCTDGSFTYRACDR
jgi:hypothetical protein